MNKYEEALHHLIVRLSVALRKEYLDDKKINEYLETLSELTEKYDKALKLLPNIDCYDCGHTLQMNCIRSGEFKCTSEDWDRFLKDE